MIRLTSILLGMSVVSPINQPVITPATPVVSACDLAEFPEACGDTTAAFYDFFSEHTDLVPTTSLQANLLPTPTPEPTPTVTPIQPITASMELSRDDLRTQPESGTHGLDATLLFSLVNQYRAELGLEPFEEEPQVCSIAQERATEVTAEIFGPAPLHSGLYNRQLDYWITENAIHQPNEMAAFQWWLRSGIHRKAITSSHRYSCVACQGNSCVQLFTDFQPK